MAFTSPRRVRPLLIPLVLIYVLAQLAVAPLPAWASRLDTDVIYGKAASAQAGLADVDRPDITARNAIILGKDGVSYFERDADAPVKIASITKVMTAIVAIENAQPTDIITVDHAAATVGQSSAHLKEGDSMPLSVALKALMIPSGNDAAMAIAVSVGRIIDPASPDPYGVFIAKMNETAKRIGMSNSVFTNPHGLDFGGWEGELHSTARDVATMFKYAMANEQFRAMEADSANNVITVRGADGADRSLTLKPHNMVFNTAGNIGGKTGSTYEALSCFVGAYSRELGGEIYVVNLGSETDGARWTDTLAMANWYYDHWVNYPLATSSKKSAAGDPLVARVSHTDWSDKTVDAVLADPSRAVALFSLAGEVTQTVDVHDVSGTVTQGEELGTVTLEQGGKTLATEKVVAAESQASPDWPQWFMVQFDRLVRLVHGEPAQAKTETLLETPKATDIDAAA